MAFDYLLVDRDQQFLLPPSLKEWLPEGHLVWFVLDVVDRVDTSGLHSRHPNVGVGRRAYDPEMLLALLVYAYCTGQRSSRQIERLCEVDVAYRVICANLVPDHTTIARFRQDHQDEAVRLFTDVLMLCAECGLVSVGVIAVDGTKIAGVASGKVNRSRVQIEQEVRALLAEAAQVDAGEDELFGGDRGDGLPEELVDRRSRRARLDAAVRELDRVEAKRKEAERAAWQAREAAEALALSQGRMHPGPVPRGREVQAAEALLELRRERARQHRQQVEREAAAKGRQPHGPAPRLGRGVARAEAALQQARERQQRHEQRGPASDADSDVKVNVTDPDSRMMNTANGWVQGYNAQAAANDKGIVVAAEVTQDVNDSRQCEPMMAATQISLDAAGVTEAIEMMLFDAGYLSESNICADGPPRLIAIGKAHKLRQHSATSGEPPPNASPMEAMLHKLCTPEGSALYKKRQHTIEPVFGTIKEQRGYRRFSRRGLAAVKAEWQLITATHNINKLYKLAT